MSKKLRIFAGPNGSGKTTLFNRIQDYYHYNTGIFINPDLIEKKLKGKGELHFSDFKIHATKEELKVFFSESSLAKKAQISVANTFEVSENSVIVKKDDINSYLAAILSEFIRQKLLLTDNTFSTETVMSDPSKIELIKTAKAKGFKVYLYYITTEDVIINIERVKSRVLSGGHTVPKEKIIKRYEKSLELLYDAVKFSDKVFLVDSTELPSRLVAEVSEGKVTIKADRIPNWYIHNIEEKLIVKRKNN